MPSIQQLTDHLFRREAGKMISVLAKVFGTENLELAEDVVQDTFIAAIQTWPLKGIPENPSGWLSRVARNKAVDIIRRNRFSRQFDFGTGDLALLESGYTLAVTMDAFWQESSIQDDLLRMMFACCHPGIHTESQITLMLKTLCGFSIAEIAKAFLTSEQTISKRLYRTKEFFRTNKVRPGFPEAAQLRPRTEAVLKAVYLLFNEGYNATSSEEHIRKDLIDQAMYLCNLLCENRHTQHPDAFAVMALMCFHSARIDSRMNNEGEIILLADQDRGKWNTNLICRGNDYLNKAAFGEAMSSYHLEAAIAYEHCMASRFEDTAWERILVYYDWLVRLNPSAFTALNRLIVIFKLKGSNEAISEIQQSAHREEWENHYLFHSLMGDILVITSAVEATKAYHRAIELTQSKAEKKLLQKKIADLCSVLTAHS